MAKNSKGENCGKIDLATYKIAYAGRTTSAILDMEMKILTI